MKNLTLLDYFIILSIFFCVYIGPMAVASTYWFYKTKPEKDKTPLCKSAVLETFLTWCATIILMIILVLWYVKYYIIIAVNIVVDTIWPFLLHPYSAYAISFLIIFVMLSCLIWWSNILRLSQHIFLKIFLSKKTILKQQLKPIGKIKLIVIAFLSLGILQLSKLNNYLLEFLQDNYDIKVVLELALYVIASNILWFFTCKYAFRLWRKMQAKL